MPRRGNRRNNKKKKTKHSKPRKPKSGGKNSHKLQKNRQQIARKPKTKQDHKEPEAEFCPVHLSDLMLHLLYHCKEPDMVSVKYEPLLHPSPQFTQYMGTIEIVEDETKNAPTKMQPRQIRINKLLNTLKDLSYQFYAYHRMMNKYTFPGIIVIDLKDNFKLEDIVPNGKEGQPMEIQKNCFMTISYLESAKQIKFWMKYGHSNSKQIQNTLGFIEGICSVQGEFANYFAISMRIEGFVNFMLVKRPEEMQRIEIEGIQFEMNLKKSGLHKAHALNVDLYEQSVFALDVFASVNLKDVKGDMHVMCNEEATGGDLKNMSSKDLKDVRKNMGK